MSAQPLSVAFANHAEQMGGYGREQTTRRGLCYVLPKVQCQQYETYEQFGFVGREVNGIDFQQRSCR
jgi:hypothetical protein